MSVYQYSNELISLLENLRSLKFSNKTENPRCFRYDVDNEFGLDLVVSVEGERKIILEVHTYGYLYGYQENTSYLYGLVKVGLGDNIHIFKKAPWSVISRGMTSFTGDKRWMNIHQSLRTSKLKHLFVDRYLEVDNLENFGYYDDVFGETPLYVDAVTRWDVTKYMITNGDLIAFVKDFGNILEGVWK